MDTEQPPIKKKRSKPREKHYNFDDSILLQHSRTLHRHFTGHLAAFHTFDPDLDAPFADRWLASIEACENHPTDENTLDELSHYTGELKTARKAALAAAADLEYYVGKAFPANRRIGEEFGLSEKKHLRARTLNLAIGLVVMKKVAEDYLAELTGAGMAMTVLDSLQTTQENLVQKETRQEYFKRLRLRFTRQRIEKFNHLYGFATTVNAAAQNVFREEAEKRALFKLS